MFRHKIAAAALLALLAFSGSACAQAVVPISQLPAASLPLTGAEIFPCVQGGVTKSCLVVNITSSPPVAHTLLPSPPSAGQRATINDAATCSFGVTPTYGGTGFCPVIYNGSAWVAG